MSEIIRHGDVILRSVETIPSGKTIQHTGKFTLAEGETTGHSHTIVVDDIDNMQIVEVNGEIFLHLDSDAVITHQEHKQLTIPAGDYVLDGEREKDWGSNAIRRVVD